MAENRQFGSPKVLQFGDKTAGNQPGDGHCAECEAMLTDALDGTLSAADQAMFDLHTAQCGPCGEMLADARRGAAFLEMLRTPAPEPPAELLGKILAQTSGALTTGASLVAAHSASQEVPAYAPGYVAADAAHGNVIPFRRRFANAVRTSAFGQIAFQPRLAMTAAMAFFSIALTMNLTGFHPMSLRASDLTPSSLKRDFFSANARVGQYYESLRVVYELESRVHDIESVRDEANSGVQSAPSGADQPGTQTPAPAARPDSGSGSKTNPSNPDRPGSQQPAQKKPAPGSGTSRREDSGQRVRLVAFGGQQFGGQQNDSRHENDLLNHLHARAEYARAERTLA